MIRVTRIQSSGTGPLKTLHDSRDVIRFIHFRFPAVPLLQVVSWVSKWEVLDPGEMDLSQWPPRLVSSTGKHVSSTWGNPLVIPELAEPPSESQPLVRATKS